MNFKPRNRHILIEVEQEPEEQLAVLLPEGYIRNKKDYITALVQGISADCSLDVAPGDKIIVPSNTVLEILSMGRDICLVLENYVLGVYEE